MFSILSSLHYGYACDNFNTQKWSFWEFLPIFWPLAIIIFWTLERLKSALLSWNFYFVGIFPGIMITNPYGHWLQTKICEISPNLGQLSTPHLCLYDLLSTSQQGGEEVRGLVSCVLATPWRGWKGGHSQQYLYLLLSTAHHSLHLSVHWSPQQESLDPEPWTCELLSISKYLKLNPRHCSTHWWI